MNNIIEIENLYYSYPVNDALDEKPNPPETPAPPVLKGVSLSVAPGEFVAVLGHNGSGKSTLAKHLNVILTPTSGTVTVCGMDTSAEANLYAIREKVGMVFQNPDNQLVATIVEEDVAFAPENLGLPPAEIRRRVDYALQSVGMYPFLKHAPHMLSGGQKQRIAIAGVLAMNPQVLVLDEPTAMLDPGGRRSIINVIKKLNQEDHITIVLITHYMDEASRAGRVVVMNEGVIIKQGSPKEVFSDVSLLKSVGLDVPQPTELMHRLATSGKLVRTDVLTVDECTDELLKKVK